MHRGLSYYRRKPSVIRHGDFLGLETIHKTPV